MHGGQIHPFQTLMSWGLVSSASSDDSISWLDIVQSRDLWQCNVPCLSSKGPDRTRFIFVGTLILISLAWSRLKRWPTSTSIMYSWIFNITLYGKVYDAYAYTVYFSNKQNISYHMSTYVVSTVLTQLPHIHQSSSHGHNVMSHDWKIWRANSRCDSMWLKKTGAALQASSSSSSLSSALSPHNEATRDQRWQGWITKSSSVHIDFFWVVTDILAGGKLAIVRFIDTKYPAGNSQQS